MIDCALFEPDIPQNAGTILRLGACFGVPVHIIHPAGFTLSDRNFKRAGMDYLSRADLIEHADWEAFEDWRKNSRPTAHRAFRPGSATPAGFHLPRR